MNTFIQGEKKNPAPTKNSTFFFFLFPHFDVDQVTISLCWKGYKKAITRLAFVIVTSFVIRGNSTQPHIACTFVEGSSKLAGDC